MVQYSFDCSLSNDSVLIKRQTGNESLGISFQRTIRVPDNQDVCQLPPSLGTFPLYKVNDYATKLTPEMVAKGGLFMPMHGKSPRSDQTFCY